MRHNIVFQWKVWVLEEDSLPKVTSFCYPGRKVDKWSLEEVVGVILPPIPPLETQVNGSVSDSVGIEVGLFSASNPTQGKQRKEKSGEKVTVRKVKKRGVRCLPELEVPVLVPVGTVEPAFAGATPSCSGGPSAPVVIGKGNRSPEVARELAGRKAWLEHGPNPLETYKVALIITCVMISNSVVFRRYKLLWRE